jgi:hypothetical protein
MHGSSSSSTAHIQTLFRLIELVEELIGSHFNRCQGLESQQAPLRENFSFSQQSPQGNVSRSTYRKMGTSTIECNVLVQACPAVRSDHLGSSISSFQKPLSYQRFSPTASIHVFSFHHEFSYLLTVQRDISLMPANPYIYP